MPALRASSHYGSQIWRKVVYQVLRVPTDGPELRNKRGGSFGMERNSDNSKRIYGAGLVKVVATVAPEDKAYLTKLWQGNASKGLRELISRTRGGK